MRLFVVLLILCMLAPLPAHAAQAPACGADAYADVLFDRVTEIEAATDEEAYNLLIALKTVVGELEASCGGGIYEGSGSQVKGPIDFGGGVYVLRGDFGGFSSVTVEPVRGECDPFFMMIAAEMEGGLAEAVFTPEGDCVGLIQVSGMGDWKIAVERMS